MATSTVRTNLNAVSLVAANNESLEYRLQPKGARANLAWVDDAGTTILTHLDFPMANELVWHLKTALDGAGQVVLTSPEKATYSRTLAPGSATVYDVTLGFVTASGYTLTTKKLDSAGTVLQTLTDVDLKMDQPTDVVDQTLAVNL